MRMEFWNDLWQTLWSCVFYLDKTLHMKKLPCTEVFAVNVVLTYFTNLWRCTLPCCFYFCLSHWTWGFMLFMQVICSLKQLNMAPLKKSHKHVLFQIIVRSGFAAMLLQHFCWELVFKLLVELTLNYFF